MLVTSATETATTTTTTATLHILLYRISIYRHLHNKSHKVMNITLFTCKKAIIKVSVLVEEIKTFTNNLSAKKLIAP